MSSHLTGQRRSLQHLKPRGGAITAAAAAAGPRRQSVSDPTAAGRLNRKLETVLAYGAEFAAEIGRQLRKLPPPETFSPRHSQVGKGEEK